MGVRSLVIIGREWYDGNSTEWKATVIIDGVEVFTNTGFGYGDHYLRDTFDKIVGEFGLPENPDNLPFHFWRDHNGIKTWASCFEVKRKRDL